MLMKLENTGTPFEKVLSQPSQGMLTGIFGLPSMLTSSRNQAPGIQRVRREYEIQARNERRPQRDDIRRTVERDRIDGAHRTDRTVPRVWPLLSAV